MKEPLPILSVDTELLAGAAGERRIKLEVVKLPTAKREFVLLLWR
jgi:hypothetical protein